VHVVSAGALTRKTRGVLLLPRWTRCSTPTRQRSWSRTAVARRRTSA